MNGTTRTTLREGDVLRWEPATPEDGEPVLIAVAEDGELWFQFAPRPWRELPIWGAAGPPPGRQNGLSTAEAEQVLRGELEFPGQGRLWKCFDAATDQPLVDPIYEDGE